MLFKVKEYLFYLLRCLQSSKIKNKNFSFFKTKVLLQKIDISEINKIRNFYKYSNEKIKIEDYGAGSKTIKKQDFIKSKDLYLKVAISKKYGEILYKLIDFFEIESVLELGTSLGLSAVYMANAKVTTIEGNNDLANKTAKYLKQFDYNSINVINSQFDLILNDLLKKNDYQLIFIDGNHTEKASIDYFESCLKYSKENIIIVFDDIYWSKGMKNAWKYIKQAKEVKLSIDLFKFGIVYICNENIEKEDVTLWY